MKENYDEEHSIREDFYVNKGGNSFDNDLTHL